MMSADELADLRAEVERWQEKAQEAGEGFKRAIEDGNRARARSRVDRDRAEKAEAERDDALARLAEAEGVARTNAAWVQHWHAAAKEAREQRDALQRQVDAVRALASAWRARGEHDQRYAATLPDDMADALMESGADWIDMAGKVDRALDAVEPADLSDSVGTNAEPADAGRQPHPTPEADEVCWRSECRLGCHYREVCSLIPKREAGS